MRRWTANNFDRGGVINQARKKARGLRGNIEVVIRKSIGGRCCGHERHKRDDPCPHRGMAKLHKARSQGPGAEKGGNDMSRRSEACSRKEMPLRGQKKNLREYHPSGSADGTNQLKGESLQMRGKYQDAR